MLLSIIIPSFQQADYLRKALHSIEQQTFKDYEIVVMDGLSKDNTREVVAEFRHMPIIFRSEPDKGIYDAMNKGIACSTGSYLYFMGCDDTLAREDVLEKIFNSSSITSNHVIYGDVLFTGNGAIYNGKFNSFKLLQSNICHQAIFTHRKVFVSLGLFDIRYKTYADWEFNMRWFNKSWVKRKYIPLVVANFNTQGFSSHLKDDIFFEEEDVLKEKYFSGIVRYFTKNINRPLHYRIVNFLSKLNM